ncbi:putative short-chain dehydrogenase/reductase SDR, NAD(P)-binding domain superfamily [Septoria linicola]|nr:putative short-chain dehydrogenase/reductase SDR, NAD(P)-binding domain superfamily [Septoria linicola]
MGHEGKTVLVTGGGGGLGRAIAENFIAVGSNVVICDINQSLLDDFSKKNSSEKVLAIKSDVTSESELDDLFAQAEKKFGTFDYIINSAGVIDKFNPAGTMPRSEWDRCIAVNLTAPMSITKRAVNGFLKDNKKGSIVNIASVASFKGFANGAAYTASKAGLIGLTKNTAAFYRLKGIRCNAIAAGAMQTNIGNSLANGDFNMDGMMVMKKTFGDWEGGYADLNKMAKLVAFLSSEDAEMINGALVTADGGITAA